MAWDQRREPWGLLKSICAEYTDLELTEAVSTLGRSPASTFVFSECTVSGTHCRITCEAGEGPGRLNVWIEDLSSNGTFLNDTMLGRNVRTRLKPNDQVAVEFNPSKRRKLAFVFQLLNGASQDADDDSAIEVEATQTTMDDDPPAQQAAAAAAALAPPAAAVHRVPGLPRGCDLVLRLP